MAASVVAVEVRSVTPLASWMPSMPTPTPKSAVSSGRPAASSEPKVTASTTIATSTPSTSPIGGSLSIAAAEPPYSTCAAASAVAASIASVCGRADLHLRDRELQVGVGDPPVLGHGAGLERVGRRGHVLDAAEALHGLLDRRLVELLALRGGEHDAARGAVGVGLRHRVARSARSRAGTRCPGP